MNIRRGGLFLFSFFNGLADIKFQGWTKEKK